MKPLFLLFATAFALFGQAKIANPGFEAGEIGAQPPGWFVNNRGGFGGGIVDTGCRTGVRCMMLTGSAEPPEGVFGNVIGSVGADGYQQRKIRLRSAIRVEGAGTRAQMWLRLDRSEQVDGFCPL